MPEEINRIVVDHMADLLCAPTRKARQNLLDERIPDSHIVVTGNTIIDPVMYFKEHAQNRDVLRRFNVVPGKYILATLHRPETTDKKSVLTDMFGALADVSRMYSFPVIIPVHPRTAKAIARFRLKVDSRIILLPPVGYIDFLSLESHARLIVTDSGGIQEEAYLLHVPCVTARTTTERPETFTGGGNVLAGITRAGIIRAVKMQMQRAPRWARVFGTPGSSLRIVRQLKKHAL
jgi:UDP-N-acetylglucosamine 2-epimerase (non-hydrolysing)